MDELTQLMVGRSLPTVSSKVPPREKRWENAQEMITNYQHNWTPNPVLTNLLKKG